MSMALALLHTGTRLSPTSFTVHPSAAVPVARDRAA